MRLVLHAPLQRLSDDPGLAIRDLDLHDESVEAPQRTPPVALEEILLVCGFDARDVRPLCEVAALGRHLGAGKLLQTLQGVLIRSVRLGVHPDGAQRGHKHAANAESLLCGSARGDH